MHRDAGLSVESAEPRAAVDVDVIVRVKLGVFSVRALCRVVYVIDEPHQMGFAYGTLAGHPERGEEAFVVSQSPDGDVAFDIVGFSKGGSLLTRLGAPVSRVLQDSITDRYVTAVQFTAGAAR